MTTVVSADLERVLAFVNTYDFEHGTDAVDTPQALRDWLVEHGLLADAARLTTGDVQRALAVREHLRHALLANHGDPAPDKPAPPLVVPLELTISAIGAPVLQPAGTGIDRALSALLAVVPLAVADGSWARAKICPSDTCRWAFYDQSKNRSRRWCTMDICGNREKSQAFRQRQRSGHGD